MKQLTSDRGFQYLTQPSYRGTTAGEPRVVQQSSSIGDYADSFDKPGSSYLWLGSEHHLDREQVAELATALQHWLATGDLFPRVPVAEAPANG